MCGGLRWFVVVCGGLWWFVVDCGGLSFSHTRLGLACLAWVGKLGGGGAFPFWGWFSIHHLHDHHIHAFTMLKRKNTCINILSEKA